MVKSKRRMVLSFVSFVAVNIGKQMARQPRADMTTIVGVVDTLKWVSFFFSGKETSSAEKVLRNPWFFIIACLSHHQLKSEVIFDGVLLQVMVTNVS